jgi:NAD(P)H-hydrate epimerase
MGVAIDRSAEPADLVVDALIGYGVRGDPTGRAAEMIDWANSQTVPVLALDTPSGLDVTTGRAGSPTIQAQATLTLALPKVGLLGTKSVGELYLADISVPAIVYQRMKIGVPGLFAVSSVLRMDP